MPASRAYRYLVVDVFTEVPFFGNPLAVFPDAQGLSGAEMQTIARELNLSGDFFRLPAGRRTQRRAFADLHARTRS